MMFFIMMQITLNTLLNALLPSPFTQSMFPHFYIVRFLSFSPFNSHFLLSSFRSKSRCALVLSSFYLLK